MRTKTVKHPSSTPTPELTPEQLGVAVARLTDDDNTVTGETFEYTATITERRTVAP